MSVEGSLVYVNDEFLYCWDSNSYAQLGSNSVITGSCHATSQTQSGTGWFLMVTHVQVLEIVLELKYIVGVVILNYSLIVLHLMF